MKIIDAFTGHEIHIGDTQLDGIGNWWTLLDIKDDFFRVWGLMRIERKEPTWVEFPVHFFHPKYFLQRIAFVPT
jgi:hypothetical protein